MTVTLSEKKIQLFQKKILSWYKAHKRDLPWRHTRNPYYILISEVMSQQTQIRRVVPKYLAWIKRFPNLQKLADAPTSEVLRFWSGLGYNRRALYLQRLAKEIVTTYNGKFPQTEEILKKLPGIGEYTAQAVLCFAFGKEIAVVDTNVKKVIAVHFFDGEVPDAKIAKEVAMLLLPKGKAYEWNQALMDYASGELKKEKIPIPKQSHFKTSNRFYRGQIIRLLLKNKRETIDSAFEKIENNGITKEKFIEIFYKMEKDQLLTIKGNSISLP